MTLCLWKTRFLLVYLFCKLIETHSMVRACTGCPLYLRSCASRILHAFSRYSDLKSSISSPDLPWLLNEAVFFPLYYITLSLCEIIFCHSHTYCLSSQLKGEHEDNIFWPTYSPVSTWAPGMEQALSKYMWTTYCHIQGCLQTLTQF